MVGRRLRRRRRFRRRSSGRCFHPAAADSTGTGAGPAAAFAHRLRPGRADSSAPRAGPERNRRTKNHSETGDPKTPYPKAGHAQAHSSPNPKAHSEAISLAKTEAQAIALAQGFRQTIPQTLSHDALRKNIGCGRLGKLVAKTEIIARRQAKRGLFHGGLHAWE